MSKVRATVEEFIGEIKLKSLIAFTSQLKIGLSFVGKIYLERWILENAKTGLYGDKVTDLFETNPHSLLYFRTVQR